MSDESPVGTDPVVRTALRLLPVPPHRRGFWDELDHRLSEVPAPRRLVPLQPPPAEAPPAGTDVGTATTVVELDDHDGRAVLPPALRRRSNAALVMAAAAAAVIVVIAGSTLVRQRDGTDLDTSEAVQPELDTSLSSSTTSAPPSTADPTDVEASSEAVMQWVAALGASDGAMAWEALGPASKERLGSRASLEDQMSALAEGYGAWSATTPDEILVTPVGADGDGTLVVVTLVGDIAPEGTAERRADAFPVRIVDGLARIEPFADVGPIEMVVPEPEPVPPGGSGPAVDGDELIVVVPDGAEAPILRLDDGAPVVCGETPGTALTPLDGLPGRRCSFTPDGGIPAGPRLLTVALRSPDGGGISAASVLFSGV